MLRPLDQLTPLPLPGTENGCCPSFSPDGRDLAFVQQGVFKRISVRGGAGTIIPVTGKAQLNLLRWAGDDEFVVTTSEGKLSWLGNDGTLRTIAAPDSAAGEGSLDVMEVLPGGRILAVATIAPPGGTLAVFDPDDGSRAPLPTGTVNWAGFSDGHLVWSQPGGLLYAAPSTPTERASPARCSPSGSPCSRPGGAAPRSPNWGLAPWPTCRRRRLAWCGLPAGQVTPSSTCLAPITVPASRPDGRTSPWTSRRDTRDVWVLDRPISTLSRHLPELRPRSDMAPERRGSVFAEVRGGPCRHRPRPGGRQPPGRLRVLRGGSRSLSTR